MAQSTVKRIGVAWLARNAAWIALAAITLYYFAQALWLMPARVLNPYANSMIEPAPIAGALCVARGETLYRDYREGRPAIPLTYGALTYAAPGWVARLTGFGEPIEVARIGRGFSLLAGIGICLIAARLARRNGAASPWHWLAAAPLLWFPYPLEWMAKFAPDSPALLFSLAGWWIAGRPERWMAAPGEGGARWAQRIARGAAAAALWAIAFHYKPNVIAGQAGFAAEFLLFGWRAGARERTRSLLVVSTMGLACVALDLLSALAVDRATGGLWRLNVIESTRICEYDPSYIFGVLGHLRREGRWMLIWMIAVAPFFLRRSPVATAFLAACALDLAMIGKQGSNVNYLLGSIVLWGIAACATLDFARRDAARTEEVESRGLADPGDTGDTGDTRSGVRFPLRSPVWVSIPIALLLLVAPWKARVVLWESFPPTATELHDVDIVLPGVPPSGILCLDAFYGQSRGLEIPFADPYHAALLARRGVVDFAPEARALRGREYRVVIGNRQFLGDKKYHGEALLPDALAAALRDEYEIAYQGRWLVLWTPLKAE